MAQFHPASSALVAAKIFPVVPQGGSTDDGPHLTSLLSTVGSGATVLLLAGSYTLATPVTVVSGSRIEMSAGVSIATTMTPDGTKFAFSATAATASGTTLGAVAVVGRSMLQVVSTATIPALGSWIQVTDSTLHISALYRIAGTPVGLLVPIDRPIKFPLSSGATVVPVTPVTGVTINGNGATITGTGDGAVKLVGSVGAHVSGLNVQGDGTSSGLICGTWLDTSVDGLVIDCAYDGGQASTTTYGVARFSSCARCFVDRVHVSGSPGTANDSYGTFFQASEGCLINGATVINANPVSLEGTTDITAGALYGGGGTLNGLTIILTVNNVASTLTLNGGTNTATEAALLAAIIVKWPTIVAVQGGTGGNKLVLTLSTVLAKITVGAGTANTALGLTAATTSGIGNLVGAGFYSRDFGVTTGSNVYGCVDCGVTNSTYEGCVQSVYVADQSANFVATNVRSRFGSSGPSTAIVISGAVGPDNIRFVGCVNEDMLGSGALFSAGTRVTLTDCSFERCLQAVQSSGDLDMFNCHAKDCYDGVRISAGVRVRIDGFDIKQTSDLGAAGWHGVFADNASAGFDLSIVNSSFRMAANTSGGQLAVELLAAGTCYLSNITSTGGANGVYASAASLYVIYGPNVDFSASATPETLASGAQANRGSFTLNGASAVDVSWGKTTATTRVRAKRKTAGGTPGAEPTFTRTAGSKVSFTGTASDTSVYDYEFDIS